MERTTILDDAFRGQSDGHQILPREGLRVKFLGFTTCFTWNFFGGDSEYWTRVPLDNIPPLNSSVDASAGFVPTTRYFFSNFSFEPRIPTNQRAVTK